MTDTNVELISSTDEVINNIMLKSSDSTSFSEIFKAQACVQLDMIQKGLYDCLLTKPDYLPCDNVDYCSYHFQQLISEIGEILGADKRWKNFRNAYNNSEEKKQEIADCFIVLMNIAMYSGFSGDEMAKAIISKISKVNERIKNE